MRAIAFGMMVMLVGCGGALSDGKSQFGRGHYPEAEQTLLGVEGASHGWSVSDQATYALYRGLTHAALGDRATATAWLTVARALEERARGSLSEKDERRLAIGIEELEMLQ
jgi:hypothetical protein